MFSLQLWIGLSAIGFYVLYCAKNPRTPGTRLRSVVGLYVAPILLYLAVQGTYEFTEHGSFCINSLPLDVAMYRHSTSIYMWKQAMNFPCAFAVDFISLTVILHILFTFASTVGHINNGRQKFRKACSCNWTRRRAYWLQERVSRADYLSFARRSKTLSAKPSIFKAPNNICTLKQAICTKISPTVDSVMERRQSHVSRKQLRRTHSKASTKAPYKPFSFYSHHKPKKKTIGFRRRCGNGVNLNIDSRLDIDCNNKIVRKTQRRKNKKRRAMSPTLSKSTSTPELTHVTAPKYQVSYNNALAAYKSMRKGSSFYPSRKVIWQNRHRLVLGPRFQKNNFYDEYNFSENKEKEYFCPEPPEEHEDLPGHDNVCHAQSCVSTGRVVCASNEVSSTARSVNDPREENDAPQWLKMGPEYNSDISGDGPVTFLVTPYCELFLKHSALSPYLLRTHLGLELCRDHNSLSFWQAVMRDCELFLKHSALSSYLLRTCMGLGLCRDHNSLSFWQAAMPDEYYHTLNLRYGNLYMH